MVMIEEQPSGFATITLAAEDIKEIVIIFHSGQARAGLAIKIAVVSGGLLRGLQTLGIDSSDILVPGSCRNILMQTDQNT